MSPLAFATRIGLPTGRFHGRTISWEDVLDAAVVAYWQRRGDEATVAVPEKIGGPKQDPRDGLPAARGRGPTSQESNVAHCVSPTPDRIQPTRREVAG